MALVFDQPGSPRRGPRPAANLRSFAPREHGAYGQLLFPLAVAHLTARPTIAGGLFTVAAMAAFVGHEPWLVLLGRRGARAEREFGSRARLVLALCLVIGVTTAGIGLAFASPAARQGAVLPALAALIAGIVVRLDAERTLGGELVVAAALPALAVPVALAGDVQPARAFATWAVWMLGSTAAVGAVRALISHLKEPIGVLRRSLAPLVVLGMAGMASALHLLDAKAVVALVPVVEVAAATAVLAPHPRHLRSVGWALVAANAITAVLLCL